MTNLNFEFNSQNRELKSTDSAQTQALEKVLSSGAANAALPDQLFIKKLF